MKNSKPDQFKAKPLKDLVGSKAGALDLANPYLNFTGKEKVVPEKKEKS